MANQQSRHRDNHGTVGAGGQGCYPTPGSSRRPISKRITLKIVMVCCTVALAHTARATSKPLFEQIERKASNVTSWPSEDDVARENSAWDKYLVRTVKTPMIECKSDRSQEIRGWFTGENATHVEYKGMWGRKGDDTSCRPATKIARIYEDCDQLATPEHLLCAGGVVNLALFDEGGRSDQGCDTADHVWNFQVYGKIVVETLNEAGVCSRQEGGRRLWNGNPGCADDTYGIGEDCT